MFIVKINEYKYQVLKSTKKNVVTLPYEPKMNVDIYKCSDELVGNYLDVETTEVEYYETVNIDVVGYDDFIIALDMYIEDNHIYATHQNMQATNQEMKEAQNNDDIALVKTENDTMKKIKVSEQRKSQNIEVLMKICSDKNELKQLEAYKQYLDASAIKRKMLELSSRSVKKLDNKLQHKYNALLSYSNEVEELLLDDTLLEAKREMVFDYIILSKYDLDGVENYYLNDKRINDEDRKLIVTYLHNARYLLNNLEKQPLEINNFLNFIAGDIPMLVKIKDTNHFDRNSFETCNLNVKNDIQQFEINTKAKAEILKSGLERK